jgi:hypothetical protein
MNPKLQLGVSILVLLICAGGVWNITQDIRRGETTISSRFGMRHWVYKRETKPTDFWSSVAFSCFAVVLGFALGTWGLYDALKHI